MTFRAQLSLFALALLLPLGILMGSSVYREAQSDLDRARQSSLALAQLATAHYREVLRETESTLEQLSRRPLVRALDPDRCDPVLREVQGLLRQFSNLTLIRPDGVIFCSAVPDHYARGVSMANMPWFAAARDAGGFFVTEPFVGPFTGRTVIGFSYPVRNERDIVAGYLGVTVDLNQFQSVLDSLSLPEGAALAVVSAKGVLQARVPALPERLGKPAGEPYFVPETGFARQGVVEARGVDGVDRVFGYTHEPKSRWTLFASIPRKQVLAGAYRGAWTNSAIYLAEAALLLLFMWLLYRWMARSVLALKVATQAVERNDWTTAVPVTGPLELRETMTAFNVILASRARAEARALGQTRVLEMIASGEPLQKTLAELARIIEYQRPKMLCTILLMGPAGQRLRHGAAPSLPESFVEAVDGLFVGTGICGAAAARRELVVVEDIQADPDLSEFHGLATEHNLRSSWSAPIMDEAGTVIGTFALYGLTPGRPSPADLQLIDAATQSAAIAISRIREKEALRLSEYRNRAIVENALDSIITMNHLGQILEFNPAAEKMFGYRHDEAVNRDLAECIVPQELRKKHRQGLQRYLETGKGQVVGRRLEMPAVRKDGTEILVELTVSRINSDGPPLFTSFLRDITENKAQQARLLRLGRTHAVLSAINNLIVRAKSRAELMQEACRLAVEQGQFAAAWIGLRNGNEARLVALHGEDDGHLKDYVVSLEEGGANSDGPAAQTLRTGEMTVINDVIGEPLLGRWQAAMRKLDYRACVVLPLLIGGEVAGCLCLYARESNIFDEEELKLLSALASDISYALAFINKGEALENLAIYDPLTRLPNRNLFLRRLEQLVLEAQETGGSLAVVTLDVNRFKSLNDMLGRSGGDDLLKKIGQRLKSVAGGSHHLCRITGDRYAIVLPGVPDTTAMEGHLRRPEWSQLDAPYRIDEQELKASLKLGVAFYPEHVDDAEGLMRCSEAALKHARATGKRQAFFTLEMGAQALEKLRLETKMRLALEREQFVLHYQPKVNLKTGSICGVEALIRLSGPGTELIAPGDFIPLLEETGQIQEVGRWVLRRALKDHQDWVRRGAPTVPVAVNVSQAQLMQADFVYMIESALAEAGGSVRLELEITESMFMTDVEASTQKLRTLRELGVSITMDDFGTGYSSLSALTQLPLSAIKIDRSFVAEMLEKPDTRTIVSSTIALAHAMNLTVIAEGVETEAQLDLLRDLGCDEMQGWLFARALPAEDCFEMSLRGARLPARAGTG